MQRSMKPMSPSGRSSRQRPTDFPIQNLPFGVFRLRGSDEPFGSAWRSAIRSWIWLCSEVRPCWRCRRRQPAVRSAEPERLHGAGPKVWSAVRASVSELARLRLGAARRSRSWVPAPWYRNGGGRHSSAGRRSATTPTSIRQRITPPMSAYVPVRRTRCCRTASGFPSAITDAPAP